MPTRRHFLPIFSVIGNNKMHRQLTAKTAPASSQRARFALKMYVRKPKILPKIVRLRLFFHYFLVIGNNKMHRQLAAKTAPASSQRARFAVKLHVRKPKILPKIVRLRLFFHYFLVIGNNKMHRQLTAKTAPASSQRARFAVKLHVRKPKILPKIAKRSLFFHYFLVIGNNKMHRQLTAKTAPASSQRARFAVKLHVRKPKILPKIAKRSLFFARLCAHS